MHEEKNKNIKQNNIKNEIQQQQGIGISTDDGFMSWNE